MNRKPEINQRQKPLILVVDDEAAIRRILETRLSLLGYDVVTAGDGEEALDVFHDVNPDLVLLDVMMPMLDGLGVLVEVRKKSNIPIIMLTALGDVTDRITGLELGADDYLCKPFSPKEVEARLRAVLRRDRSELEMIRLQNINKSLLELNIKLDQKNKSLEKKLESNSKNLSNRTLTRRARKEYEVIFSAIAHSLKGEFLNIGYSVREIKELAIDSSDIQEECNVIERSIEYSQILMRRLLNYLDISNPRIESITVSEIWKKLESIERPRLASNIKLNSSIEPKILEKKVNTDSEQVILVLHELIKNAKNVLQNKDKGFIEICIKQRIDQLSISVKDNGGGIPEDLRKKLFKKKVSSKSGWGIGLFLCNKVIDSLEGKLELESSSSNGSKFTVLLPLTSN